MELYAITKGDYSDYHICALTADKDKAEELRKVCSDRNGDAEIETYIDGDMEDRKLWWSYDADDDTVEHISNRHSYYGLEYVGPSEVYLCAPDPEHARKKAHDMIAKYKAEQAGL